MMIEWLFVLLVTAWLGGGPATATSGAQPQPLPAPQGDLDRIAFAVEGAESSHGRDPLMWQPNWRGPQGPMQVSEAAHRDVGSGNRFDLAQNREIGRAYLAGLFRRYGNWTDAVAAYNWGPGNLDRWIAAGRPAEGLSRPIQAYLERVLGEFRSRAAAAAAPVPAPALPSPPAQPAIPPEIKDAALKQRYERNAAAITDLRDFIGGDDGAEKAVRAAFHSIAARPGYAEFKGLRPPAGHAALGGLREMARVLLGKLQAENAAIALIDQRRRGGSR